MSNDSFEDIFFDMLTEYSRFLNQDLAGLQNRHSKRISKAVEAWL